MSTTYDKVTLSIEVGKYLAVNFKGEKLMFRFSTWGLLTDNKNDIIFGPTNGYLATLPEPNHQLLFDAYKEASDLLSSTFEPAELIVLLQAAVKKIHKQVSFNDLKNWIVDNGIIKPCMETSATYTTSNPAETTYLRHEAFDLSIYAVFVKLLSPIWGFACRVIATTSGNNFKEMDALAIVYGTGFDKEDPYLRLLIYSKAYADRRKANTSTAVKFKMATADLENYIMALYVIRRLVPYEFNQNDTTSPSIVKYGYKFIEGKLNKLRHSYTDKFANDSSGDNEDSLVDHYRIAEDIPMMPKASVNIYLKDVKKIIRDMKVEHIVDYDEVRKLIAMMVLEEIEIHALATPILAHCMNKVIHRWIIDTVDRKAKIISISVVASMLSKCGHHDIALVLTSRRVPKESTTVSLGMSGTAFNRLTAENNELLSARYPFVPGDIVSSKLPNPGLGLIDQVVRMITTNDWPATGPTDFVDIRNSLAQLLIRPPYTYVIE